MYVCRLAFGNRRPHGSCRAPARRTRLSRGRPSRTETIFRNTIYPVRFRRLAGGFFLNTRSRLATTTRKSHVLPTTIQIVFTKRIRNTMTSAPRARVRAAATARRRGRARWCLIGGRCDREWARLLRSHPPPAPRSQPRRARRSVRPSAEETASPAGGKGGGRSECRR